MAVGKFDLFRAGHGLLASRTVITKLHPVRALPRLRVLLALGLEQPDHFHFVERFHGATDIGLIHADEFAQGVLRSVENAKR